MDRGIKSPGNKFSWTQMMAEQMFGDQSLNRYHQFQMNW